MTKKILFITILVIFAVSLSACSHKQLSCTKEAKICPDGSGVGRNPENNCEFNPCPENEELEDADSDGKEDVVNEDEEENGEEAKIDSFEDCIKAGNPAMESYPRQCRANGTTFVEEINNTDELTEEIDKLIPDFEDIDEFEELGIAESDEIKVVGIAPGSSVISPLVVQGEGTAFENTLIVELRNNDHVALVQEIANIKSSDVGISGPFKVTINFSFQNTKEGYVAVYEESAKDGSEQHLVEIPVKFQTEE